MFFIAPLAPDDDPQTAPGTRQLPQVYLLILLARSEKEIVLTKPQVLSSRYIGSFPLIDTSFHRPSKPTQL